MAGYLDVCRFTPTAGGTTDWTYAAAVFGYQSPALAGAVNATVYRYRAESADLSQWEIGFGAYTTGTGVLARTTVLFNSLGTGTGAGQSGAGTKINFSGIPQVAVVALAEDLAPMLVNSNNLSDVSSVATARTNLGVSATGVDVTYCFRSNNLSDLASAATARINLGVSATGADTTYAFRSNNLSDLGNATTARTNIGAQADLGYTPVNRAGDSMTGNLSITKADPASVLNKTAAAQNAAVIGQLNGTSRWFFSLGNNNAESGSNAGSDVSLYRYTDAGAFIGEALGVNRATGITTLTGGLVVATGNAQISAGNLNVVGDLYSYRAALPNTGVIFLNSAGNRYLYYDGSAYTLAVATLNAPGGVNTSSSSVTAGRFDITGVYGVDTTGIVSARGYQGRNGTAGTFSSGINNGYWTGAALQCWVDVTNLGNFNVTSDYRIKSNVKTARPALEEVLKWRPITYTGKKWGIFTKNDHVRHSFVAHELQAISPDCVVGEKDGEQPQSLDLVPIVARLAKAIQELSARVDALAKSR